VLQKEDDNWVKKCLEFEVEEVARPRGRPKSTWRDVVHLTSDICKLNWDDVTDRSRWRKQIKDD